MGLLSLSIVHGTEADPKRFAAEIAAFIRAEKPGPSRSQPTVFVGGSSFRLWTNIGNVFPKQDVLNRGFGGAHVSDVNHYFSETVATNRPSRILLYAGDNDLAAGKSPERIRDDFAVFLRKVRLELGDVPVAFVAIKPSPSRMALLPLQDQTNQLIRDLCTHQTGAEYLDVVSPMLDRDRRPRPELFQPDQLHLNARGYEVWQPVIASWLERHPAGKQ